VQAVGRQEADQDPTSDKKKKKKKKKKKDMTQNATASGNYV